MSDIINDANINEEDNSILILNDENGNEVRMEYIDLIEYEGEEYVVLLPADEDADEVVILKIESSDEETDIETYVSVEDDKILQTLFEIFKDRFKDVFNFID